MHPEAYSGFGWALAQTGIDPDQPWRVLDVGGQDVNGTVHDYFPNATITTLDIENADLIADARTWVPDRLFDIVIATEVFEHVEDWRAILTTMRNALDPNGPTLILATCASDARPPHGATGAPLPAPDEWYRNVPPAELEQALRERFVYHGVRYLYPPGDAYMWAAATRWVGDVSVVIPTIPSRKGMLRQAMESVQRQTLQATAIYVETDKDREGPAIVRNRGVERVQTEWVAFLDDDDMMHPHHLATLMRAATQTGADVVWPWFEVEGGRDPFPMHRGRQWDPTDPHQIPITALVRTSAFRTVGGFRTAGEGLVDRWGNRCGEDWQLWLDLSDAGYKFHHVDAVTWTWVHHARNSSGIPARAR